MSHLAETRRMGTNMNPRGTIPEGRGQIKVQGSDEELRKLRNTITRNKLPSNHKEQQEPELYCLAAATRTLRRGLAGWLPDPVAAGVFALVFALAFDLCPVRGTFAGVAPEV